MPDDKRYSFDYDLQIKEYNSFLHDVLFGMCFQYISPNEKLLDMGIGTGLSSINYAKFGLEVHGIDSSTDMLKVCKLKSFAKSLTLLNISDDRIPFKEDFFDHVVCCGVLHFIGDLEKLFMECSRVIKSGGIFSFTIALNNSENNYEREETVWGVPIIRHSKQYIDSQLKKSGFKIEKEQRLLTRGSEKEEFNMLFSAIVATSVK